MTTETTYNLAKANTISDHDIPKVENKKTYFSSKERKDMTERALGFGLDSHYASFNPFDR